ncbi:MAG: MBL fold metallo-hydrolase [Betaproteobacteria bacterium]|nr:MBL fold metallo-hydrolase [Betaproteobacteria bacterium]
MPQVIDYEHGISAIDSGYHRPMLDAIHLMVEGDRAAIIDTGTNHSVPLVLEAMREKGLRPEQVDYVILTHVHLDHAGGAGLFMREFPNATLTVHPHGARHMTDLARLLAGTVAVYGEEPTRQMYGDVLPVPAERILETPHASSIRLAGRELQFLDTPGHARHHVAILDTQSGHVFAGDVFGLSYREMDQDGRQFILPSTSPAQFDPEPYHRSIDLILRLEPEAVYVTHYSRIRDIQAKGEVLHRLVDAHAELGLREKDAGAARRGRLREGVKRIFLEEARRWGSQLPDARILDIYSNDVELNAQGLGFWLDSLQ